MDLNRKQSQFELFPATTENLQGLPPKGYLFKNLTLSLENTIVLSIIFLMVLVLSFSFGVEKGRSFYRIQNSKVSDRLGVTKAVAASGTSAVAASLVNKGVVRSADVRLSQTGGGKAEGASLNGSTVQEPSKMVPGEPLNPAHPLPASPQKKAGEDLLGQYTIQVASFKEENSAQKEALKLQKNGHQIFVLSKGKHLIVCVGKFVRKIEAENYSRRLKNKYDDCLVRRF